MKITDEQFKVLYDLAEAAYCKGLRYVEDTSGAWSGGDWVECRYCKAREDVIHKNSAPDIIPETVEHKKDCPWAAYGEMY